MILLCDLDGTLLKNSMGSFQPAYLKALSAHLADSLPPDRMIKELLLGTQKMIENSDPTQTLEDVFDDHFYPHLGVEKRIVIDRILDFYKEIFPGLGNLTRELPQAINFIRNQQSKGDRVIIATNPLFPRIATYQRLVWAGIPLTSSDFELVTTYEHMHFAKPNPAYYAEILAYLGYPSDPVLMIGNDLDEDMIAAGHLGIPGYWLTEVEPLSSGLSNDGVHRGNFDHLDSYLKNDFAPGKTYPSMPTERFYIFMKATLAALDTYNRAVSHQQSALHVDQFEGLIANRHAREIHSLLPYWDPSDFQENHVANGATGDSFTSFTNLRLTWLSQFKSLRSGLSEEQLSDFFRDSIQADRELLGELTRWELGCPKFNLQTS